MTTIQMPARLAKLRQYQGFPITYTTWVHPVTKIPDFKINDEHKRQRAITKRLCAACGEKMNKWICFIGGAGAIEGGQCFVDAGMHPACAEYAWEVCPYIIYGRGHAEHRKEHPGAVVLLLREIPTEPMDKIGMMTTDSYEIIHHNGSILARAGKAVSVRWRVYER